MGAAFVTTGDEASLVCRRRRTIMNSESRAFRQAQELAQALRDHARETQMPEYASMMLRAARELEGLALTASANNSGNSLLAFA
jgi:hypothetical protein